MNFPSVTSPSYAQLPASATSRAAQQTSALPGHPVEEGHNSLAADNNQRHIHQAEEIQEQPDSARKQAPSLTDSESIQQQKVIAELAARDREVRAHEQAHASVGGVYAGAPTYTYEHGPNGKKYAVAGEVSISVSPIEGDPEATIRKADQVRRAALAPAEPSSQDRAVAAQASQMKLDAQVELQQVESEAREANSKPQRQSSDTAKNEHSERMDRLSNRLTEGLITEESLLDRTSQSLDALV